MKLIEAVQIGGRAPREAAQEFRCFLGCGFTPLHLLTYFRAYLATALPDRRLDISTARYGDLIGSLERLDSHGLHAAAVSVEWSDLDPRLGLRHLGGWRQNVLTDIVSTADSSAARLMRALEVVAKQVPVTLSLPTLPLPPAAHTTRTQQSAWEQQLAGIRQRLGDGAVANAAVRLVSAAALDAASPLAERGNFKSELACGFPYSLPHAEAMGHALADLVAPATPRKGLITDLDDTLWSGLLGEIGANAVTWDLEHHSLPHGLYQQFLAALAERGILVAVASKNDELLVEEALARPDLLLARSDLFPVIANWGPKSESVTRILAAWNIGPESVVFVDDSPIELAEVQATHPAIECIRFPKEDPAAVLALLGELRDRFGKARLLDEDRLRAHSLRQAEAFHTAGAAASQDALLASVDAVVTFSLNQDANDARALELINKTNQFNLNGRRLSEGEWNELLARPGAFLLTASYRDKFGPLGKIAVVLGCATDGAVAVDRWVMSCRAFSRRIEHQCLRYLFERLAALRIRFDFAPTPRNTPLQECFAALEIKGSEWTLSRAEFDGRCPALYQQVEESSR